jgi:DNA-binding CsgD family transcriptional regulator
MTAGRTDDGARLLDDFVDWGSRVQVPQHALWSAFAAAWLADTTRFGELVDRAASLARERGELGLLADALGLRAVRLAVQQQPDEVLVAASEAAHLVRELGTTNLELLTDSALALIFAFQGRDEEARQLGERVLRLATAKGLRLRASSAVAALAAADVAQGRWSEAYERLHALLESGFGALDPVVMRTLPDKIEAAVRAGRTEDARAALSLFEEQVAYSRESSAPPRLAASQALLAAGTDASTHFEDALRLGTAAYPLDLARIHLLYGEHLRRSRRRTTSRVHFRAALDGFERLGAEPWAERARSELRASGETARKRDPSTIGQLTPQELQVARFVAEGLSNKEVAAQLFLSPRTIDAHLRNVFSKLGVTSRTQLARLNLEA